MDSQPVIAFRADGAAIASVRGFDEGEVAIRDITDPTNVRLLEHPIKHQAGEMLFGPDGTLLVTGGTDVLLWDVSTASQPQQLGSPLGAGTSVLSLALSADGNTLAVGGAGLHDLRLGHLRPAATAPDRRPAHRPRETGATVGVEPGRAVAGQRRLPGQGAAMGPVRRTPTSVTT